MPDQANISATSLMKTSQLLFLPSRSKEPMETISENSSSSTQSMELTISEFRILLTLKPLPKTSQQSISQASMLKLLGLWLETISAGQQPGLSSFTMTTSDLEKFPT